MRIVGIDPGLQGAVCSLKDGAVEHVRRMPFTDDRLEARTLLRWLNALRPDEIIIENYVPVRMQNLQSTVTGASNHGKLVAVCDVLALPIRLVDPWDWHRAVGLAKDDRPAKARALELCQRLFPTAPLIPEGCRVPHDGIVDAILIAYSGLCSDPRALTRKEKPQTTSARKNQQRATA